jgi:hypothetical protein
MNGPQNFNHGGGGLSNADLAAADEYLNLVAEYMQEGCGQDDAEIMADNEMERRREMWADESPGSELEDSLE